MTKAPFGKAVIGANPNDRGKHGTKCRQLSEEHDLSLAIVVASANAGDITLVATTLDAEVFERPASMQKYRGLC